MALGFTLLLVGASVTFAQSLPGGASLLNESHGDWTLACKRAERQCALCYRPNPAEGRKPPASAGGGASAGVDESNAVNDTLIRSGFVSKTVSACPSTMAEATKRRTRIAANIVFLYSQLIGKGRLLIVCQAGGACCRQVLSGSMTYGNRA